MSQKWPPPGWANPYTCTADSALPSIFHFVKILPNLDQLSVHDKTEKKVEDFHIPLPPTASPSAASPPGGTCVTIDAPMWAHHRHPESLVCIGLYSWGCTFCGFGQCMMTSTHHHSVMESSFTLLKILWALPIHPPLPQPLGTTHPFTVFTVLLLPECLIVGITQLIAFSNWLLSLSNCI